MRGKRASNGYNKKKEEKERGKTRITDPREESISRLSTLAFQLLFSLSLSLSFVHMFFGEVREAKVEALLLLLHSAAGFADTAIESWC